MFARLESTLPRLPRWPSTTLRYRFGKSVDDRFYGISYFVVDGDVEAALLGILPEALRPLFICSYLVANYHDIPPHIDNGIQVSLNYYIATAEATTTFYRFKEPRPPVEPLENSDPGSASGLYRRQDLEPAGSFRARAHELWALDVTRPHDVVSEGGHGNREAYCLQSREVGFERLLGRAQRHAPSTGR